MVHLVLIDKRSCLFTGFVFCAVLLFFWEKGGYQDITGKLPLQGF